MLSSRSDWLKCAICPCERLFAGAQGAYLAVKQNISITAHVAIWSEEQALPICSQLVGVRSDEVNTVLFDLWIDGEMWGTAGLHADSLIPLLRLLFTNTGIDSPMQYGGYSLLRGFARAVLLPCHELSCSGIKAVNGLSRSAKFANVIDQSLNSETSSWPLPKCVFHCMT